MKQQWASKDSLLQEINYNLHNNSSLKEVPFKLSFCELFMYSDTWTSREEAWDEVNKRGSESAPWMGLYVRRRLFTIRKMLKSCLKSKEMFLLLCATDEKDTKAANLICSNSRMHLNIWKALGWNWTKPFKSLTFQFIPKGIAVSETERYFSILKSLFKTSVLVYCWLIQVAPNRATEFYLETHLGLNSFGSITFLWLWAIFLQLFAM